MNYDIRDIASNFLLYGNFANYEPFGEGHINHTFKVNYNQAGKEISYILQKINTSIFTDPVKMTDNILRITSQQKKHYSNLTDSSQRHLTPIMTHSGDYLFHFEKDNSYWRVYLFIDNSVTYQIMENESYAYKTAKAFGEFQNTIVNIEGGRLHEVIPDFHNTPKRFEALEKAIKEDIGNRANDVKKEINFAFERAPKSRVLLDLYKDGLIPERIVHNDTKLNNLLLDKNTGEPLCVIDLDIVMPGFSAYDFGELMRTSLSPTAEDEKDISKITIRMNIYEALLSGFMESASGFLNRYEVKNLPWGGYLMALENGVRFLSDHLNMDKYFRIHWENQNLDRCRTQFALIRQMETRWNELNNIIEHKYAGI